MLTILIDLLIIVLVAAAVIMLISQNKRLKEMQEELWHLQDVLANAECTEHQDMDTAEGAAEKQDSLMTVLSGSAETIEERQDVEKNQDGTSEASEYNTGKSGKIYTKEELELLIKE